MGVRELLDKHHINSLFSIIYLFITEKKIHASLLNKFKNTEQTIVDIFNLTRILRFLQKC